MADRTQEIAISNNAMLRAIVEHLGIDVEDPFSDKAKAEKQARVHWAPGGDGYKEAQHGLVAGGRPVSELTWEGDNEIFTNLLGEDGDPELDKTEDPEGGEGDDGGDSDEDPEDPEDPEGDDTGDDTDPSVEVTGGRRKKGAKAPEGA